VVIRSIMVAAAAVPVNCAPRAATSVDPPRSFTLRYVETETEAMLGEDVHPLIAELRAGLLDLMTRGEARRVLEVNPSRTSRAPSRDLLHALRYHAEHVLRPLARAARQRAAPGGALPESEAEGEGEAEPAEPERYDERAAVQSYVAACSEALAAGVERARVLEAAASFYGRLVAEMQRPERARELTRAR
jgi:hypothetical protein